MVVCCVTVQSVQEEGDELGGSPPGGVTEFMANAFKKREQNAGCFSTTLPIPPGVKGGSGWLPFSKIQCMYKDSECTNSHTDGHTSPQQRSESPPLIRPLLAAGMATEKKKIKIRATSIHLVFIS